MPNIDQDAANIVNVNLVEVGSDPATPGSGHARLYVKNGALYLRLDDGTVLAVGAAPTLTENSLAVGGTGNTLSALTPGATGAVPTRQADGTISEVVPSPGAGGALTVIDEVVVGAGGAASIDFTGIAGTYAHLRVLGYARSDRAAQLIEYLGLQVNGVTSGYATYGGPTTADPLGYMSLNVIPAATAPADDFAIVDVLIPHYANTVGYKHVQGLCSYLRSNDVMAVYRYHSTSIYKATTAISRVTLINVNATNFVEGTRVTLYGFSGA